MSELHKFSIGLFGGMGITAAMVNPGALSHVSNAGMVGVGLIIVGLAVIIFGDRKP